MHELDVVYQSPRGSLAHDLAEQICDKGMRGRIAVVADKPAAMLAATRKQWLKLMRRAQRDRSSTLNVSKIAQLTQQIAWMQSLRFTATAPEDLLEADVTFASAEDFVHIPPICLTVYVTYKFEREKLYMLTSWMPKGGRVVIYE